MKQVSFQTSNGDNMERLPGIRMIYYIDCRSAWSYNCFKKLVAWGYISLTQPYSLKDFLEASWFYLLHNRDRQPA